MTKLRVDFCSCFENAPKNIETSEEPTMSVLLCIFTDTLMGLLPFFLRLLGHHAVWLGDLFDLSNNFDAIQ
jgi:hypothetical protein